jgi:glucan phosphorylase
MGYFQDIIARFKERKSDRVSGKWSELPTKVVVQLNDTHPTLAIFLALNTNVFKSSGRIWSTWDRPGRLITINRD